METESKTRVLLSKEKYNNLKSTYLEQDYKNDLIAIDSIEIIDSETINATLKVNEFTLDKGGNFHLSSVSALVFFQQMSIIIMSLNLGKTVNDAEVYTNKLELEMSKLITSKVISLETKITSSRIRKGYKFFNIESSFQNESFVFKGVGIMHT